MNLLPLFMTFVIGEMVAVPVFMLMRTALGPKQPPPDPENDDAVEAGHEAAQAMAKGLVERLFLYLSLLVGIPQALTAFGALKIATRISDTGRCKISNDYFLIGNLTSIGLAVAYYAVAKGLGAIA